MMKRNAIKCAAAVFAAAVLSLLPAAPAFAAEITVQHVAGAQTYRAYQLLSYTTNLTETGLDRADAEDAAAISGGSFAYYLPAAKIDADGDGSIDEGSLGEALDQAGIHFTRSSDGTNWYVSNASALQNGAALAAAVKSRLSVIGERALSTASVTTAADEASAQFTGLANGYWFVTSTTGTLLTLETIDTVKAVFDKNEVPSLEKKITAVTDGTVAENQESATGTIGKTVSYSVTITAKPGAENYIFHDRLSRGLTLQEGTLAVSVNGSPVVNVNENDFFTKTRFENTAADGKDDITLTFKKVFLDGITEEIPIVISYVAVINQNAEIGAAGNPNSARLQYGHLPTDESKPGSSTPADEPKVYVYSFDLVKTTADGRGLTGAEFRLYADAAKAKPLKLVQVAEGVKYRIANGTDESEASADAVIKAGTVTIEGLANGTYYLEETKAPNGYNKLNTLQEVTIADRNADAVFETEGENRGAYRAGGVQVINRAGAVLPGTGGIGTTIFYAAGTVLAVGAGVVLVTRRRLNALSES